MQTGSNLTAEAAYWAGQGRDEICMLRGRSNDHFDHVWKCSALAKGREIIEPLLAKVDPDLLPAPVKLGFAPAMSWDLRKSAWCTRDEDIDTAALYAEKASGTPS